MMLAVQPRVAFETVSGGECMYSFSSIAGMCGLVVSMQQVPTTKKAPTQVCRSLFSEQGDLILPAPLKLR